MKRFLIITLIACLLIPFFAINTFASSYDLGSPYVWAYSSNISTQNKYSYYSYYEFDGDFVGTNDVSWRIWYYPDGYSSLGSFDPNFSFSVGVNYRGDVSYDSVGYKVRASELDTSKNVLAFAVNYPVTGRLYLPAISYKGIYFPSNNQVIKVEFSIDTVKLGTNYDIPSLFNSLLNPSNLCWFELERIPSNQSYKYDKIPFSSVVVTPSSNGKVLHYTYYFNAYGTEFQSALNNSEGSLLQLVIRFPYYFGNSNLLSNGVFALTNADLPTSYDILTPGDYSQELEGIQNAITVSNEKLMDYYDTLSGDDQAIIVHQKQQNDKLDNTIKDYDNAQTGIDDIVHGAVLPSVNLNDVNSTYDTLGIGDFSKNNSIWSSTIISMAVIVFSFGSLSLILFGKKG